MPTKTKENYLKAIYFLDLKKNNISITDISLKMNVSKPTTNNMVKKMEEKGWVIYEKYKPIKLTSKGKKLGALIVRKHRLTEMFLSQVMSFGWEEVHDIAEEIEHIHSEIFFDRMDEILGFPSTDPHGSPIPDKNGKTVSPKFTKLNLISVNQKVRLCGLENSSKELLLFLNKKNIKLGTEFTIINKEKFDSSIEILLRNNNTIFLTDEVSLSLLVDKLES